jgi:hypothetical protein
MPVAEKEDLPFSARYSLPAQLAGTLGEVSWESVAQLSTEFQLRSEQKSSRVKKIVKEIQMTRLILMDRIRSSARGGGIEPRLLVDVTKLLQHCEEVAEQYDLDLREFSSFLYLVSEKLKKEKLARISARRDMRHIIPIEEEFSAMKGRTEPARRKKGRKK